VAIVPTWRRDIALEADVAEEIARVHGYEAIPGTLPDTPIPAYRHQPLELRDLVRETLAGAGLTEVVTHALVSPRLAARFAWATPLPTVDGGEPEGGRRITVTNPLSVDHSVLRPGVVGSLVEVASSNIRHGRDDVTIFEIGKGYGQTTDGVREWWRLALAGTGPAEPPSWNRHARPYDLDDAKGAIELLCSRLGFDPPDYKPLEDEPVLHRGRAATVQATRDGAIVLAGRLGELHPTVADEWDLRGARVVVGELDVSGLAAGRRMPVRAVPPPRHPVAERDLAIVVSEATPSADVIAAIRAHAGTELASIELFDIYRGAPLPATDKSLAVRLVFRAADRTLTEADVDTALAAIGSGLATAVGGRIRT
jgi:phenylalanyl-tRNA synthetase beta chain